MMMLTADYRSPEATRPLPIAANGAGASDVAEAVERTGFAVTTLPAGLEARAALELLASLLHLGEPYVPEVYRLPGLRDRYASPYARIERNDADAHPGFSTASGQRMHVDGLLDPIGRISTTALYCVRPSVEGGATVVFNAVAALAELRDSDPDAADVLMHPEVLSRRVTIPGVSESRTGPAFAMTEEGIVNRYSVGESDEWSAPAGREQELQRALAFFAAQSAVDGRHRASIVLQSGQCLLSRNDRVSHGREEYLDSAEAPRSLMRALYTKAPR
jgi:hypothetical protein